jgi:uncharacterized protein (DUF433 family)
MAQAPQRLRRVRFRRHEANRRFAQTEATIMVEFNRITQQPGVMGGKACVRGTRVTVGMIVGQIGAGITPQQLLADYPYLELEDILQALRYAAWRAEEREIELAAA